MQCDGAQEPEDNGLLLFIGDGDFALTMGDYETRFWRDDSPWKDGLVPAVKDAQNESEGNMMSENGNHSGLAAMLPYECKP